MMAALKATALRGHMKYNEPMAKHTTWRVGGVADKFYTPADIDDLAEMLAGLPADEPVFWLGLGSNLLVRDGGIRGTVIALKGSLAEMCLLDQNRVKAGAAVTCAKLARYCSKHNLVGGEFFAGIPGLLGGALAMNAGAFGGETWRYVESVTTMDRTGKTHIHIPSDYEIGYRSVKGCPNEWFVEAILHFEHGNGEEAAKNIRKLLDKRAETQPVGLPSCGSVFTNPDGDYAARLIEASGLKGVRIGGAEVSPKHANFIINVDHASAQDIEDLIYYVQQQVKQKQGVDLHTEVRIVGERQK
ncbi:MAG: UDP-N-acetylmuramate dehydrogenase [Gammaproteobacteria bacterium]|nr:MAG: UDP-N-acetylmuramate dehydrogenase [Gammaproteobacteria bacterium]